MHKIFTISCSMIIFNIKITLAFEINLPPEAYEFRPFFELDNIY